MEEPMPYDGKPEEWLVPGPGRQEWDWGTWGVAVVIAMGFIMCLALVNDVWKEERQKPTYPAGVDLGTWKQPPKLQQ
jgi:hypothetical protein